MTLWKFPKEHFPYYTSAVIHTHKFRLPKKLVVLFMFIFVLLAFAVYSGLGVYSSITESGQAEARELAAASTPSPTPSTSSYSWSSTPEAIPVAGCIANESRSRCQCFSAKGVTLDLSHAACLSVITTPFPRNITASSDNKKD